jgi:hypothetical protein
MTHPIAVVLLVLLVTQIPAAPHAGGEEIQKTLIGITEEILEAIRTGNRGLLEPHLAPEMILINRDGKEYPRAHLLEEVVPPPAGYDLRFRITESRVIDRGDSALLTFLLDEHLAIFGHDVSTVYRNHFLFHRLDGAWKLVLYTYWEKPSTPPVIAPPPAQLDPFVGTYALAPGRWVTRVTREGGRLRSRREGQEARDLLPMAGDRFYIPGVEGEYYFEKDASGKAVAMVFRRNWIDLRLTRVQGPD